MKYIIISLFSLSLWAQVSIPQISGPVLDQADVLSTEQESELDQRLRALYEKNLFQLQIWTLPTLEGEEIEATSLRAQEQWQLDQKNIIILLAMKERKIRVKVGNGLNSHISEYDSQQLVKDILAPNFKRGEFFNGFMEAITNLSQRFEVETEVNPIGSKEEVIEINDEIIVADNERRFFSLKGKVQKKDFIVKNEYPVILILLLLIFTPFMGRLPLIARIIFGVSAGLGLGYITFGISYFAIPFVFFGLLLSTLGVNRSFSSGDDQKADPQYIDTNNKKGWSGGSPSAGDEEFEPQRQVITKAEAPSAQETTIEDMPTETSEQEPSQDNKE